MFDTFIILIKLHLLLVHFFITYSITIMVQQSTLTAIFKYIGYLIDLRLQPIQLLLVFMHPDFIFLQNLKHLVFIGLDDLFFLLLDFMLYFCEYILYFLDTLLISVDKFLMVISELNLTIVKVSLLELDFSQLFF